jgi:hypothetical protein
MKGNTTMCPPTRLAAILGVAAIAFLAGCSGDDEDGGAAATTTSPPPPTAAAPDDDGSATTATMVPPPSSPSDGTPYSTKQFVEPLDLVVPKWLIAEPTEDSPHFVTFSAPDESLAIRILLPVLLYPPGRTGTTPPPNDYVDYLFGQADFGAQLTDRVDTTVDGRQATIVTAATGTSLDGSLGCPDEGIAADSCFGLQPDKLIRLAVIPTDTGPLLIWLRTNTADNPDMAADAKLLDDLLATLRFADRQPEASPADTAGPLDGTYTWTITKKDALANGSRSDQTPEGLALFPNTLTVTIDHGTWDMSETSTSDTGHGAVEATEDQAIFHWDADTFTFDIARDPDGTLQLTPVDGLPPEDVFIWTTEPWTPVRNALEGTYRWTLTAKDAHRDPSYDPNQLSSYPWTFTMVLSSDGTCSQIVIDTGSRDQDPCTYDATGDRIDFHWQGLNLAMNYTADPDGTLHMTGIPPIDPGDSYAMTSKPWIKQ